MTKDPVHSTDYSSLIPEKHLLTELSPLWKQRFTRALYFMRNSLGQYPAPSWRDIASHSAVSANHFHRMFRLVFQETPIQYLSRIRMAAACYLLISDRTMSVSDVALSCGYSTSQALAKAIKREIGMSAKEIRVLGENQSVMDATSLLPSLNKPKVSCDHRVEAKLAEKIEFGLHLYPQRSLKVKKISPPSLPAVADAWKSLVRQPDAEVFIVADVNSLHDQFEKQSIEIGCLSNDGDAGEAGLVLAKGNYLRCQILISNEEGYAAAVDAMFRHLLVHNFDVVEQSKVIAVFHNPEELLTGPSKVTLNILVEKGLSS